MKKIIEFWEWNVEDLIRKLFGEHSGAVGYYEEICLAEDDLDDFIVDFIKKAKTEKIFKEKEYRLIKVK